MPDIPSIGEQYANAASYARSVGVEVEGDQETFGQRLTEVWGHKYVHGSCS
jgi:hypothetical protein